MIIISKTPESLCQHYRDEQNDNITEPETVKSMIKITRRAPDADNT